MSAPTIAITAVKRDRPEMGLRLAAIVVTVVLSLLARRTTALVELNVVPSTESVVTVTLSALTRTNGDGVAVGDFKALIRDTSIHVVYLDIHAGVDPQ